MLFLGKMRTLVHHIAVAIVFFPSGDTDYSSTSVMIPGTEESIEPVKTSGTDRIQQCRSSVSNILLQDRIFEMKFLPVPILRFVYRIENSGNARNQRHPGQISEKERSIE